jgi:glycosyltransferase involved in cell wall biosynthesis
MLAQRLVGLLDDPRLRETMGMSGYYRVRDQFTFEVQARLYQEVFSELAKRNGRKEPSLAIPNSQVNAN